MKRYAVLIHSQDLRGNPIQFYFLVAAEHEAHAESVAHDILDQALFTIATVEDVYALEDLENERS